MHKGFFTLEILLALALLSLLVLGVATTLVFSQQSTLAWGNRSQGILVAQEGIEALRSIRDTNFATLTNGTYGLAQTGGAWTLSGTSDTLQTGYTRSIVIASGSSANSKEATVNVTWTDPQGQNQSTSLTTRLTNWRIAVATGMAGGLVVNTASAVAGASGNRSINGMTLANSGATPIILDKITVSWTGGASGNRLQSITIDGSSKWVGSNLSGTVTDITNTTLAVGVTTHPIVFRFSKSIQNATLTMIFTMTDATTKTVTFGPLP
jgi:Tfp pilus assembly protein PilV